MKIRSKIHTSVMSITALIAVAMSSSCIDESYFVHETSEDICFSAQLNSDATKSTLINQFTKDTRAGVIGYVGTGSEGNESYSLWDRLNGKVFKFDGDQMGAEGEPVKWNDTPANTRKLRIYSYIPNTTGVSVGQSSPTIEYEVSENVSEQIDLITSYKEVSTSNKQRIPMNFTHALTAIQFRSGFECRVKSITVSNVLKKGIYSFEDDSWDTTGQTKGSFTVDFDDDQGTKGMKVFKGDMITFDTKGTVLMMIPQSFGEQTDATISMTYYVGESNIDTKTITTSLTGASWKAGDMITYTLNERQSGASDNYIYFDLAAGEVTIDGSSYKGYVYVKGTNGAIVTEEVYGTNTNSKHYYIYQSNPDKGQYFGGYQSNEDFTAKKDCVIPEYAQITYNNQSWADFITNYNGKTSVEDIIEIWDDGVNVKGSKATKEQSKYIGTAVVRKVGRTHTTNRISVKGDMICHITLDNIYSTKQHQGQNRTFGTITFLPSTNGKKSELTLNMVGDNRLGSIHYVSSDKNLNHKLIFEGKGSLTVADADFYENNGGYYSNHYDSVIGASDNKQDCFGITINSGTIFAGSTKAENCSAIGAGGNGEGHVTINGGRVTAVASTTGTAIGGGIGYSDTGGIGNVYINGGSVYAYNYEHTGTIPSSAIGGAGSSSKAGSKGTVVITGGNVYAYSEIGTAIGGGSSNTLQGGDADIRISGNATVIAQSGSAASAGIGGGSGGKSNNMNGGTAKITISEKPIIRTGSIGGGGTLSSSGKIGSANINISGGDIQAQFVMAAGAATDPEFIMTDGLIRNSQTNDSEYKHIKSEGGAVYLEAGRFEMSGGEIRNCSADLGGAIYIKGRETTQGQQNETKFILSGNGKITECISNTSGGAVYLENGSVYLHGGEISGNLANNGNGGGICIVGGNLYMQDASQVDAINNGQNRSIGSTTIKNNAAFGGSGGGVYVSSSTDDVTVNLHQGKIQSNSATRYGGGVCVDMGEVDEDDSNTINVSQGPKAMVEVGTGNVGPEITFNHSTLKGGGLYASGTDANITINAGSIKENTVSGYVDNPNVANEGGMVTLNGDDVTTFVTVTYNNNFEYHGQSGVSTETQRIVTNTNTKMIAPTEWFAQGYLLGYTLSGWNTRPDGKGISYSTGATMKLSSSITLFAQWTR